MAEVINLNRARKAKQRAEAETRAAENRIAFGRTKAEKQRATAERKQRDAELNGKKLED